MTAAVSEVIRVAMTLSPVEREEIAETLLHSIDGGLGEPDESKWRDEINRRIAEARSGEVTMLTREQVDTMIAQHRAARGM